MENFNVSILWETTQPASQKLLEICIDIISNFCDFFKIELQLALVGVVLSKENMSIKKLKTISK